VQGTSVCLGGGEGSIREVGGCDDEGIDMNDDGNDTGENRSNSAVRRKLR
jgi:hypothetical protein